MARERDQLDRRPFHIIIDEGHAFPPDLIRALLVDPRKYSVSVTVATQFLQGLDPVAQQAVLGSTDLLIAFRLGIDDAQRVAPLSNREHQDFNPHVLFNLAVGKVVSWRRALS